MNLLKQVAFRLDCQSNGRLASSLNNVHSTNQRQLAAHAQDSVTLSIFVNNCEGGELMQTVYGKWMHQ